MISKTIVVGAKEHSVTRGAGAKTNIVIKAGQLLVITAAASDTWSAGTADRTSNANGLGNPLGGNYGLHQRADFKFLFGSLVGSLDGGKTFFGVGTYLAMTMVTSGELTLHYWDSNTTDNSGAIAVNVQVFPSAL
ncbi:MAG TPA: hypothetical protein VN253_28190 [Kofleriaceae bacterium]|nr:hypothetical protein [Kofleriaceae bacterium]